MKVGGSYPAKKRSCTGRFLYGFIRDAFREDDLTFFRACRKLLEKDLGRKLLKFEDLRRVF